MKYVPILSYIPKILISMIYFQMKLYSANQWKLNSLLSYGVLNGFWVYHLCMKLWILIPQYSGFPHCAVHVHFILHIILQSTETQNNIIYTAFTFILQFYIVPHSPKVHNCSLIPDSRSSVSDYLIPFLYSFRLLKPAVGIFSTNLS